MGETLLKKYHDRPDYAVVVPKELLQQAARTRTMFNVLLVVIAGISLLVPRAGIGAGVRFRHGGSRRAVLVPGRAPRTSRHHRGSPDRTRAQRPRPPLRRRRLPGGVSHGVHGDEVDVGQASAQQLGRGVGIGGRVVDAVDHDHLVGHPATGSVAVLGGRRDDVLERVLAVQRHDLVTHRVGHGMGMDGHEWPYLVKGNTVPLEVGNTFSDEPGIYIPAGMEHVDPVWWSIGVRIEDDILVTEDGYEVLTKAAPKEAEEIESLMKEALKYLKECL